MSDNTERPDIGSLLSIGSLFLPLPPLTRRQRIRRWFRYSEPAYRAREAWHVLRHGASDYDW